MNSIEKIFLFFLIIFITLHNIVASEVEELENNNRQVKVIYFPSIKEQTSLITASAPIVLNNCIGASEYIVSRWALSQISQNEMAVSELIEPSQGLFTTFGTGLFGAVDDLVAEEIGKYNLFNTQGLKYEAKLIAQNIGRIYRSANLVGFFISLPTIMLMRAMGPFYVSLGYNEYIYSRLDNYYNFFSLCVPIRNLCFLNNDFSMTTGHASHALMISAISLLTCSLQGVFILGPDSFRFSDVFHGVACALTAEAFISFGGYLYYYNKNQDFDKYNLFSIDISKSYFCRIIKQGWPILLRNSLLSLTPLLISQFIIPDQSDDLALYNLSEQIFFPSILILDGLGKATKNLMKSSIDESQKIKYAISGISQTLLASGSVALSVYLMPEVISSIFVSNKMLIDNFKLISFIKSLDHFVFSASDVNAWVLRGLGDTKSVAYSGMIASLGITLPVSYILTHHYGLGVEGVITGVLMGNLANLIYSGYKLLATSSKGSNPFSKVMGYAPIMWNRWFENLKND